MTENLVNTSLTMKPEIDVLHRGELIVYPTEAVWGIGCDPDNEHAFNKLLIAKGRPIHKGVILIASDYSQALPYVDDQRIPIERRAQILSSWPGPVTWLLPAKSTAPHWLTGGSELIAIRVTSHPTVRRLCKEFGKALVSTSANYSGQPTPHNLDEVKQVFAEQVAFYVDEPLGGHSRPSKILNAMTGEVVRA